MPDTHDFLAVQQEPVGFLMNRNAFFASVYLAEEEPLIKGSGGFDHCRGTIRFRRERLLIYRLDERLAELFSIGTSQGSRIALIADTRQFSTENRDAFQRLVRKIDTDICEDMMAFRIGSQAEIQSIPLHWIRLIPERFRGMLKGHGILGCQFPSAGTARFLVDVEAIFFDEVID